MNEDLEAENRLAKQELADALASLNELIRKDRERWPRGHPCRDCGRPYDEHFGTTTGLCVEWR